MTTPYHVRFSLSAQVFIKALPAKHQKTIIKLAEALAVNPRPPGAKKIDGMIGLYSEPVDAHRMIYKIEDQEVLILVIK